MASLYNLNTNEAHNILSGSVCSFGVFDGVHKGHRSVIDAAIEEAEHTNKNSVIVTFDIDPDEIFKSDSHMKLMSNSRRIDYLRSMNVDAVVLIPFTREFALQDPENFLNSAFKGNAPSSIHVGEDFRFGRNASGGVAEMREWGSANGMSVYAHKLLMEGGAPITSTRIRDLLKMGDIENVESLLGHELF